jgi:hypothetical protein
VLLADALMVVTRISAKNHTFFEGKMLWKANHHLCLLNFHAVEQRQKGTLSTDSLRKKGVKDSEINPIIQGYLDKAYKRERRWLISAIFRSCQQAEEHSHSLGI